VLVIGGGDGGVLREIAKHDAVEEVVLCELDEAVIRVSRKYLPTMAVGLDHPKVTVHVGDGFEFMTHNAASFDVIITDSNDAVGPAAVLYQRQYYQLLHSALTKNGIMCSLADSIWSNEPLVRRVLRYLHAEYPSVDLITTYTPEYITGQLCFVIASKSPGMNFSTPQRAIVAEGSCEAKGETAACKYYSPDTHRTCFAHPPFLRQIINECLSGTGEATGDDGA
ncbi:putrescine aminopropyltransferase, partial [Tieghemiomyces parasiticus]